MRPAHRRWSFGALLVAGAAAWGGDPEPTAYPPQGVVVGVSLQMPKPIPQDKPQGPQKPDKPGKPKDKEPAKKEDKPRDPLAPPAPAPAPPPAAPGQDALARLEAQGAQPSLPTFQLTRTPAFLGDPPNPASFPPGQVPGRVPPQPPQPPPVPRQGGAPVPSVRGFKIAEHESPAPLDRAYVAFNYYDNINAALNLRLGADVRDQNLYRETFAFEKTFLDGSASVGMRLPLNSLSGQSTFPELDGTSTGLGDLSVILKYALLEDREAGNVLSVGLGVTAPTGRDSLAGSPQVPAFHGWSLQPFVGWIVTFGDFFVHGFTSIDVPTYSDDVTLLYNDIGVGYYLYRTQDDERFLTSVVPTFEVHVNTPLNHRGALSGTDVAGTPDVVDLTFGTHVRFRQCANVTFGVVTPITGPRPFDIEAIARFELRF